MLKLSRHIPSMFQRRLLLLAALGVVGLATPLAQMARLSVVKGEELRVQAEKRLVSERWLETTRGRILDRKGRVLAMDRPCFDIAVDYPVITGQWAYTQAARRARKQHRSEWAQLSPDQRDLLIQQAQTTFDAQLDAMWARFSSLAGISRADLEERRLEIRRQVQDLALTVTERKRQLRERQLEERLGKGEEQSVDVATADVRRPIREQSTSHVLLKGVPESVGFEFARLIAEDRNRLKQDPAAVALMPGVEVLDSGRREYPFDVAELDVDLSAFPGPLKQDRSATVRIDGVATHVIGWMRSKLYDEDMLRRPRLKPDGTLDRGHYRPGDMVGQGGIEQGAEDVLRGLRGVQTLHLDTEAEERIQPEAGGDVKLTLDAALQARIQALFDPTLGLTIVQPWHRSPAQLAEPVATDLPMATPLDGSVVVIDVASGDVLAMVSMPSFSHHTLETQPELVFGDQVRMPYLDRAIDKAYPPGSIVKPVMLCSAITAGKLGVDERVHCTGAFYPDKPNIYRCWIYKMTHNQSTHDGQFPDGLDGSEAIQVSCNIFFFEMGRRLGPVGVTNWFTRFGVGPEAERWQLFGSPPVIARLPGESDDDFHKRAEAILGQRTLLHEYPGSLTPIGRSDITPGEAVLMGIGQGPITWTPMHAADAYATVARGGVKLTPRLRQDSPQKRTDLGVGRAAVRKALEGLRRSANEPHGTTYEVSFTMPDGSARRERTFNTPGVSIWAKSGTADAPPWYEFVSDDGGEAKKVEYDADHAWCVFLAGVGDQPKYAVSVVIEHGGSGGRVAGPVANQVVRALVAEGYLPDAEKGDGTHAAAGDSKRPGGRTQ